MSFVDDVRARRSLQGRVVIVTGGSAGIGRSSARRLHAAGATVVICARGTDRLQEAAAELPGVQAVTADMTSRADRERLVEQTVLLHGRLDGVVLNAGQGWAGLVEQMRGEDVDRLIDVNVTATIDLARIALPHLLVRGGDLVAISSVAAWSQVPPLTVYCATKTGVEGFLKGLRREVTARGVRVHSINPGPVRTEWLARGHGHPPLSDGDGRQRLSPGVSPELVGAQVAACFRSPWSRTVTVPRVLGLARLGEVTPVNRILDMTLSRSTTAISALAEKLTAERVPDAERAPGGERSPG